MRLLKMYESGLPAWAVFLPRYGLWYRPWFRRAAYLAFIAISIFSMAVGFWDLYKNVPYVDKVLRPPLPPLPSPHIHTRIAGAKSAKLLQSRAAGRLDPVLIAAML